MINPKNLIINSIYEEIINNFKQNVFLHEETKVSLCETSEEIVRNRLYIKNNLPYIRPFYSLLEYVSTSNYLLYTGILPDELKNDFNNINLIFYDYKDISQYTMPIRQFIMDYLYQGIKIYTISNSFTNNLKESYETFIKNPYNFR